MVREQDIEAEFTQKLQDLKYAHRPDLRDRAVLEANLRAKFETLKGVPVVQVELKTLTSFKASTLPKDNPAIDKCLFVVDRKDLDRHAREEFALPTPSNALN
ncbi:MAG: hypothetical protein RLZZ129_1868 [Verrucomicrobiota bacterium]|jgi:hypothetical protein